MSFVLSRASAMQVDGIRNVWNRLLEEPLSNVSVSAMVSAIATTSRTEAFLAPLHRSSISSCRKSSSLVKGSGGLCSTALHLKSGGWLLP